MKRRPASFLSDRLGVSWPIEKLDQLLADQTVYTDALSVFSQGLRPHGAFNCQHAFEIAKLRYPERDEAPALLVVLAVRIWQVRAEG